MSPALVKKPILEAEDVGLKTISIKALMDGEPKAHEDLLAAGVDSGFFYLDCRDHPSADFLKRIREIHDAAMDWYDEPQSAKDKWAADHDHVKGEEIVCGYKPAGVHTGPVEGKRDGFEGTLLPLDQPMPAPKAIQEKCQVFRDTMRELGDMGRVVFESLSKSIHLEGDRYLPGCHRQPESSTTALGMLKYVPWTPETDKVGHIAHTDTGSLSMVFSDVGGLQVLTPREREWVYCTPKKGHAVCNLGDCVEFLSDGKLRSSLHRVVPHPNEKDRVKLTLVYLMRPETDAIFTDREGTKWKSVDWHNMKNRMLWEELEKQKQNMVVTGQKGYMGLWDPADHMDGNITMVDLKS
ncbi:uncharacterized protein N7477_004660 [Penicillium maclennaniae]|uniref:uncharacterized protein n=1 Tax=Penicillium maclennaniae TaxID=1343394 RepID=UPI00254253B2|nr:uncharacterized protein N7477_004660 [Penicillium maclennaniae]KAJ5674726.1 hypothetical protein N7477_004660 [Penicillium maclennaniae]